MVISGFGILVGSNVTASSTDAAISPMVPSINYNVTFVANGLTSLFNGADTWTLFLDNGSGIVRLYPTSDTYSLSLPAGTYTYEADNYFQALSVNSNPFTVSSNTTIYLNFSTPQTVTFNERGLGAGYNWGVNLQPTSGALKTYSAMEPVSSGSSAVYYAIPGDYSYNWYVSQNGTNISLGSSQFTLGDSNLNVSVPISTSSNVTFSESNLPAGTTWYVRQVSGPMLINTYAQSTSGTITLKEENGMNTFVAGYIANGYLINLTYLTVDVGSASNVQVNFPTLYLVNIIASNFPAVSYYYGWGTHIQFYYGPFSNNVMVNASGSQSINILLPQTTVVETPFINLTNKAGGTGTGYTVLYDKVGLVVSSSGQKQVIKLGTLYDVTINFLNYPALNSLTVKADGGSSLNYVNSATPSSFVKLLAPNGSFSFYYDITPHVVINHVPFNFAVSGSNIILNFELYDVNFTSADTSSGFTVYVGNSSLNGPYYYGVNEPTAGGTVYSYLINGTYGYFLYSNPGGPSALYPEVNGTFTVSGKNQSIQGKVPTKYYNATIETAGLPAGAEYGGHIHSLGNSTLNANINQLDSYIWLPAGSYEISGIYGPVLGSTIYGANDTYFNVTSGGPNDIKLDFSSNAYLTITEQGLPSGLTWSVNLNGKVFTSDTSSLTVYKNSSQSLNFTISPVGNYYPNPSSGSLTPHNTYSSRYLLPVTFTPGPLGAASLPISTLNLSNYMLGNGSEFPFFTKLSVFSEVSNPLNGETYITYSMSGSASSISGIYVINSATYNVEANIQILNDATIVSSTLDLSNNNLYVGLYTGYGSNPNYYISTINVETDHVQLTPVDIPGLSSIVVYPGSGSLFAQGNNAVYVLNPSTLAVQNTIFMNGAYQSLFYSAEGLDLAYSPHTGLIYATGYIPNGIVVINPANDSIVGTYTFSIQSYALYAYVGGSTLDNQNGILYYTLQQYDNATGDYYTNLIEFNLKSDTFMVGPSLGQGYALNIAYDSSNGFVYIPLQMWGVPSSPLSDLALGQLDIYDPSTGMLVNYSELGVFPNDVIVDPSNNNILITSTGSGTVTIFSPGDYGYINGTVSNATTTVTVNGVTLPVFNGHFAAEVLPGIYYISAFAPGYSPVTQDITVKAFSNSNLSIDLNKAAATYEVSGQVSPAGASVMFNGISASVNSTGYYQIYLSSGKYTVSTYLNGYFPTSQTVDVTGNTEFNLSLTKEPTPQSVVNDNNVSAMGFNVTISTVSSSANGSVSIQFNATTNGILTVEIPYADLANTNISDILHSRVFINGAQYSDFSIIISSNYTVVLKVMGLKGDPTLVWAYSPSYVAPPSNGLGFPLMYIAGAIAAVILIAGVGIYVTRKRKRN